MFLITVCRASGDEVSVHINTSNKKARIGDLVTISVQVTGNNITSVNWGLCDSIFKANKQIDLLGTKSSVIKSKIFKNELVFTSPIACTATLGPIPFLINYLHGYKKIYTGTYPVTFNKDKIPAAINDIKPVIPVAFSSKIVVVLTGLLFSIAILTVLTYVYGAKPDVKNLSPLKIKQRALQNIALLEDMVPGRELTNLRLNELGYEILMNFLDNVVFVQQTDSMDGTVLLQIHSLKHDDHQKGSLIKLVEKSETLLYSNQNSSLLVSKSYLSDIKWFITNYQAAVS